MMSNAADRSQNHQKHNVLPIHCPQNIAVSSHESRLYTVMRLVSRVKWLVDSIFLSMCSDSLAATTLSSTFEAKSKLLSGRKFLGIFHIRVRSLQQRLNVGHF